MSPEERQLGLTWIAVLLALAVAWLYLKPVPGVVEEWTKPRTDSRVEDLPKKRIKPPGGVIVIDGPAKEKLDLPDEVKENPSQHVAAAVVVRSDERPQSVATIFDESTGEFSSLTQRMEYPWLQAEQRGQVWVGYGLKTQGAQVGRILVREDLLQLKAIHLGVTASADTDGSALIGVGAAYRW